MVLQPFTVGMCAYDASMRGMRLIDHEGNGAMNGAIVMRAKIDVRRALALVVAVLLVGGGGGALSAAAHAAGCPNEASPGFRAYLPDCRAYELVSPPYMEGATVNGAVISEDASHVPHVIIRSYGVFAGAVDDDGGVYGTGYEFTRGGSGWGASALEPPALPGVSTSFAEGFVDVSSGFERELYPDVTEVAHPGVQDLYVDEPGRPSVEVGPELSQQAAESPRAEVEAAGVVPYRGASSDLSHVLFSVAGPEKGGRFAGVNILWPGDETAESEEEPFQSLYEYEGTGNNEPALVGVSNAGRLNGTPHINEGAKLISQCGTYVGSARSRDTYNAVSQSGSTVFFTAMHTETCLGAQPAVNELYARINASETVAISEPSTADCTACLSSTVEPAEFQGASQDGSKVFFLSNQELLAGASGKNLYEYDFDAEAGRKVALLAPNVLGVARVSQDGSRVYFVAAGEKLEVYDAATGHTTLIATLSPSDEQDWSRNDGGRPVEATAPDGGFLLFASHADLKGEGTEGASQLFRYDAQTGELVRVSIGQGGSFNNDGKTSVEALSARFRTVNYRFNSKATHEPQAMSDDGSYVFFQSADGLTPQALNNVKVGECCGGEPVYANNVYEYHDGNVYLISDGHDLSVLQHEESIVKLVGTDASGSDVIFQTSDALVPQGTNTGINLYDARIGGGFPAPALSPGCSGDACQGSPGAAPGLPAAGSVAQPGGGNLAPAPESKPAAKAKAKPLTRAQKLAQALKACAKKPPKRRAACKAQARNRYGAKPKAKKSDRRGK